MVRLTETDKWNSQWFRGLEPRYKLLWLYLQDTCSIIGTFELDIPAYNLMIGYEYTYDGVLDALIDRLHVKRYYGTEIFCIKGFVKSQRNDKNVIMRKAINNMLHRYDLTHDYEDGLMG